MRHGSFVDGVSRAYEVEDAREEWMMLHLGFRCCRSSLPSGIDPEAALGHPEPGVRMEAVQRISGRRDELAARLLSLALNDPDPGVRWVAGQALGPEALSESSSMLNEVVRDLRSGKEAAGELMARIGPPSILVETLGAAALNPLVLDALLERHEPEAVVDYRAALGDRSFVFSARCVAAILLLDQGDETGLPLLREAVQGSDSTSLDLAVRYLRWMRDPVLLAIFLENTLVQEDLDDAEETLRLKSFLGPYLIDRKGLAFFRGSLGHSEPRIREFGARIVGLYRDRKALSELQGMLQDPSPPVRGMAEWALERLR